MNIKKDMQFFCENVKSIRRSNHLTQKEMAEILGIGVHSLSRLEKGELPRRMSVKVLFNIHKHFGILPKDLFLPPCE